MDQEGPRSESPRSSFQRRLVTRVEADNLMTLDQDPLAFAIEPLGCEPTADRSAKKSGGPMTHRLLERP